MLGTNDRGSFADSTAGWPRFSFRRSLMNLARAVSLLAQVIVPIAVLSISGLAVLHLLYLRDPSRTDGMKYFGVEILIVQEQLKRAAELPAAEIAFLGDSSCLMGVDAPSIEDALDLHPVQSFCSIGFVGPAGYARMLAGMIERNVAPKVLVLVFHPVTFQRDQDWDFWSGLVANGGKLITPPHDFPSSSLDFLAFEWLSRLIYTPLPGAYALYYGGEGAFRSTIRARQGSAIDPNAGLNISSRAALHPVPTAPSGKPADFSWNQTFVDTLKVLGGTIKELPPQTRVYLVVPPVPDYSFRSETEFERSERANQIASALGIDTDQILKTPATMFAAFFSGYTHLNRWGQKIFTEALIKELAARRQ